MQVFFLSLTTIVYSALCFYAGVRLLKFIRFFLPAVKAALFWPPFIFLCFAFVFTSFMRLGRLRFPSQMGVYWMAFFVYLLLSLAAFDTVRLVLRLTAKNILTPRFNAIGTGAALCVCVLIILFGALYARIIKTVNYNINIPAAAGASDSVSASSSLRLTLISDIHLGTTVNSKWTARIVNTVNKTKPDIICIAGDVFDGHIDNINDMPQIIAELKKLNAPLGVYACLGNHDVDRVSFSMGAGNERITQLLRETDITVLEDEVIPVGNFYLAGRRDIRPIGMKALRKTADDLLAGFNDRPLIVLDHQPMQFAQLEKAGADLVLSGHTHRGQLFPANFITRAIFKKAGAAHYGYFKGEVLQAVITSGAGVWGPPLRVGTSSEAAVIDITFTAENSFE